MQTQKNQTNGKGGRPKKAVKRSYALTVKCNIIERKVIERKAKDAGLTVSEYLRDLGLTGKIDRQKKLVPPEILEYKGTLNHLAANLNQIAKKRNSLDELNALERAQLLHAVLQVKQFVNDCKNYLQ